MISAAPIDSDLASAAWAAATEAEAARKKAEAFNQAAIVEKVTGSKLKARIKELEGTTL